MSPGIFAAAAFGRGLASLCDGEFMLLFAGAPLGEANGKRSGVVYNFPAKGDGAFQLKQALSLDTPGVPATEVRRPGGGRCLRRLGAGLRRLIRRPR